MSRRPRKEAPAAGIAPVYEGPEVLAALLTKSGCPLDVEEVFARFASAIAADEPRAAVIPTLFEAEPHFASPDDARRLYANLFGLWARVADGRGPHDDAPEVVAEPPPPPPMPERGSVSGSSPPSDVVEGMWRQLAVAPQRELQRLRDRFANTQPELGAWLDDLELTDGAVAAALDLAFETWAIFDQAFGERIGVAAWSELRTIESEPPSLESEHPALAAYVSEQLDNLTDEDPNFGPSERAQVERALAAVAAALSGVVSEPS